MRTVLTGNAVEAAEFIKRGGVVAFPTETVYGLGANVFDEKAIAKVFEAKRRPADNPLIAHVASIDQIPTLSAQITESAGKLIDAFFPGPLTVVLKKTPAVPSIATAGLDTVGIRMPANELAHKFIAACGVPVVAPSANLSGKPSPTTWEAVAEDLDGRIDCILQGDATDIGIESTVVDCSEGVPRLLRLGAISLEQLWGVVPETRIDQGPDHALRSPGIRHTHYKPAASVVVLDANGAVSDAGTAAFIGLHNRNEEFALMRVCTDAEYYAHFLFEFFRECDRRGVRTIYCEAVPETGIGAALMDRIRRAAAD